MYTPIGQQSSPQQQMAQQQQVTASSGGLAAAIRASDASLQAKKKEARRIYERAETQMRTDLDTVAAFNATAAGTDAAPAIQAAAEDLRNQIREANDPVEARRLIGQFSQKYNLLKAREDQRAEDSTQLNDMSTSTGSQMAGLNAALPPGMEYDEVDAGTVARADQAFRKDFQYVDGEIMVVGPEGDLVPLDQAAFINDTSVYQPSQRKADVGDLQTSAMSEAVQTRIIARGGGLFREKNAVMEYDTLAENSNRSGTVLRMQINEDYLDESGNSSFFDSPEEAKAFELGPNAFSRVQDNPELAQAWKDVWGEDGQAREKDEDGNIVAQGTGWELLNTERSKFVDYARTSADSGELLRRKNLRGDKDTKDFGRYSEGSLGVTTEERMEDAKISGIGPNESAEGYLMTRIVNPKTGDSDPIKIQGSDMGQDGEYLIQAFGVDPLYGIGQDGAQSQTNSQMMAKVTIEDVVMKYDGPEGELSQDQYDALDPSLRAGYTSKEVKTTKQQRIPIGPGTSVQGQAIYNTIIRDPEALRLLNRQTREADEARGNYSVLLNRGITQKREEEESKQAAENQLAQDLEDLQKLQNDALELELKRAGSEGKRAEILRKDSFEDNKVVTEEGGRPVYSPPADAFQKDGKWYTPATGDTPIGRVYRYDAQDGGVELGMRPLK